MRRRIARLRDRWRAWRAPEFCETCGKKTRRPVKVVERFEDELGGTAMVATFCPKDAPDKEARNAA